MTLKTYALESMAYLVSAIMDRGGEDYQIEAAMCKIYGTEAVSMVADETLQILGGIFFF
jgi:acyl-CoA dehydrogenase family protein 9